jgi:DNA-binding GntR family transcriptional regulator
MASVEDIRNEPVERIRKAIVSGKFMPNEHLVEGELAEWLGINRVNVRVALARLEQEGLVVSEPNRGARVRFVSETEAIEITQVRDVLESMVAREAALKATAADKKRLRQVLVEMRAAIAANDFIGYSEINGKFHTVLREVANQKTAERILKMLSTQVIRFQYRAIMIPGRPQQSYAEHKAIVDAICDGDAAEAESCMRAHLSKVKIALERALPKTEEEDMPRRKSRA